MKVQRRSSDLTRTLAVRLLDSLHRARRAQSQFSAVTSVVAGTLALVMLIDFIVGHQDIERGVVAFWIASYLIAAIIPLVCGRSFPRWAGLIFIGFLTFWGVYSMLHRVHPHMELNTLLEVPVVAVYLGWFYRPAVARGVLAAHLIAFALSVLLRPLPYGEAGFSSNLVLLYAVLIGGFCLEAGTYLRRRSEAQARRDPLTGALNRRGLSDLAHPVFARADRHDEPLVFVAIDFDDFKAINDSGGHAAGDRALCESARHWMDGVGPGDLVARTGGDEFALLIHADAEEADQLLGRLCRDAPYSWSWGLARRKRGERLDELMRRADAELYLAKDRRADGSYAGANES